MLASVPCMPSIVALHVVQGYRQADCPFQDLVEQHGSGSRVGLCRGRRAGLQICAIVSDGYSLANGAAPPTHIVKQDGQGAVLHGERDEGNERV